MAAQMAQVAQVAQVDVDDVENAGLACQSIMSLEKDVKAAEQIENPRPSKPLPSPIPIYQPPSRYQPVPDSESEEDDNLQYAIDRALVSRGAKWAIFIKHDAHADSPTARELATIMSHAGGNIEMADDVCCFGISSQEALEKVRTLEWPTTDEQTALGVMLHLSDWEKGAIYSIGKQLFSMANDVDVEPPIALLRLGYSFFGKGFPREVGN